MQSQPQRDQHSEVLSAVVPRSGDVDSAPSSTDRRLPVDISLASLRQRFIERTGEDLIALERGRQTGNSPDAVSIVHRLAGTAGMLGYTNISAAAGRLDDEFARGEMDTAESFSELLATLRSVIAAN